MWTGTSRGTAVLAVHTRPGGWLLALVLLVVGGLRLAVSAAPLEQPELLLQSAHASTVMSVAWHPRRPLLASAGTDRTVRIWDLTQRRVVRILRHHDASVYAVAWSPDGKRIASGGQDDTVCVFDPDGTEPPRVLTGHGGTAMGLAWSPDGRRLASCGVDGHTRIWDAATGARLHLLREDGPYAYAVAWSPDSRHVAAGGREKKIRVWDAVTGRPRWTGEAPFAVRGLSWSPDSRTLASAVGLIGDYSLKRPSQGELALWDVETGRHRKVLSRAPLAWNCITWHPRGRWLLAAANDLKQHIWDAETGEEDARRSAARLESSVAALSWSPDGSRWAIGATNGGVFICNASDAEVTTRFDARSKWISAVRWSPDGSRLATATWGGAAALWDPSTGEPLRVLSPLPASVLCYAWRPDAKRIASGTYDGSIQVWDPETGRLVRGWKAHAQNVECAAWSSDGRSLASGSWDTRVKVWDAETGALRFSLEGHASFVRSVAWSPDSRFLASCAEREVRVWDSSTGTLRLVLKGHTAGVRHVAWSPDGKHLASAGLDRSLRLWDPGTGEPSKTFLCPSSPSSLDWSPDGRELVVGQSTPSLLFWNPVTGENRVRLSSVDEGLFQPSWEPRTGRVAAAAGSGAVRIWSSPEVPPDRWVALIPLVFEQSFHWMAVTSEGYFDGSPGSSEWVLWQIRDAVYPAARFENQFRRPAVVRQALRGEWNQRFRLGTANLPPIVQVEGPATPLPAGATEVALTLSAWDDSEVKEFEVFVDGRPVRARSSLLSRQPLSFRASPGMPSTHRLRKVVRLRVPLPPGQELCLIRSIAFDDSEVNSEPDEILVRRLGVPVARGRLFALSVGVSRYRDSSLRLRYPAADARTIAAYFRAQTDLYSKVVVEALLDEKATQANLKSRLTALQKQVTSMDTIVLYLAGHGLQDRQGRYFFATHDTDISGDSQLARTALSAGQFSALLGRDLRARRVLVFVDTCHSGGLHIPSASNDRLATAGTLLLASARPGQLSWERERWGHGVFTLALLEGFRGHADPGSPFVRFDRLAQYVGRRVADLEGPRQQVSISPSGRLPDRALFRALPTLN